ncbi:AP2-associated protein kinase 1-like [Canna indica]|uniref:non-specific serine/threonine protein kinase n=1 Tax=Canna indica TaxID=4628 RepID=A0AAQ3QLW1_9LILI|nr:AP2-associated protein kinase 1-like [Canna indica]
MWMFKPFAGKEPVGLEGRTIDVGNVKIYVRNVLAEGGFSCVYIAQDVMQPSKHYALKHMICNDSESLDLVTKEISVMKLLRGHPNIVTLVAHTILDMGRRKEALLVMEFCEKSLATMLENRGVGYFEEKKILLIFRDVCNAVYAMHSQSPPAAHRDLKAENILLGFDGAWKLCDFGSTSTNHKCFDKPEEMGIEEDIIRKHTTPAYRAPEMWDLLRREVICEKVDIWALGCLLYRICYLKAAFDGESKLQILNGNYRIPDLPKYNAPLNSLIKDMLQASPNARPDILQARALLDHLIHLHETRLIWFRVNELLPVELQKHLPHGSAGSVAMRPSTSDSQRHGVPRKNLMSQRSPPPPSSQDSEVMHNSKSSHEASKSGGALGAFWSTQHAKDSTIVDNKGPSDVPINQSEVNQNRHSSLSKNEQQGNPVRRIDENNHKDFEINFFQDTNHGSQRKPTFENQAFNTFVADFDNKLNSKNNVSDDISKKGELEAEVVKLKEQLKKTNLEKSEITSKYEKLCAICRSQRQEIQELKQALAAANPTPPRKDRSRAHDSAVMPKEKIEETIWDLQQGMMANPSLSQRPDLKPWNAFAGKPQNQAVQMNNHPVSVGTTNGHQNVSSANSWGFNLDSFTSSSGPQVPRSTRQGNTPQMFNSGTTKKADSDQPAGWAGF